MFSREHLREYLPRIVASAAVRLDAGICRANKPQVSTRAGDAPVLAAQRRHSVL
jgi:hypothetical protein